MKFLALVFLTSLAFAQGSYTMGYGGSATGSFTIGYGNGGLLPGFAQLPLVWADDRECNPPGGIFDVTRVMGVNYTANAAGLNLAIQDWATSGVDQWEALQFPLASFPTGLPFIISSQITLLGKPNATKCLVFMGTGSLPANQTACSHKTADNNDGSSPRDLSCTHDVSQLATIEGQWTPGNKGQLFTACQVGVDANCTVGPNHYAWKNLELRPKAGTAFGSFKLFNFNDGDQTGLLGSNHNWFLQNYLHADASETAAATNQIASVIDFTSSSYSGAVYNYFDKVLSLGSESHIITATWMPGPLKFVGNWVEGASIPIFFGGAGSTILPYENVFDAEIRRNRFTHSPQWLPLSGALALKSSGELKTCSRCLIDGNIFENSNTSGSQKGQCFTLTVRNTSGGASGENYLNSIDNITFTNNTLRHCVTGIETAARSGSAGNGGGAAQPGRNWLVSNNLFYDIAPGTSTIYNNTVNIPFVFEVGAGGNFWNSSSAVRDPTGQFVTLTLVDGGAGLHKTTMSVGDLVQVQGCTDPSFNTPLHNVTFFAEGPKALTGTQSFILVSGNPAPGPVVYTNAGTPNATTLGCIVNNGQGFQQGFTVRHNTVIGSFIGSSGGKAQIPACLTIDTYAQNYTFQDNLIAPLSTQYAGLNCQGDGNTEGKVSEANMADPATFVFNHNAFIGRNANSYADYPGAVSPSTANWFPTAVSCPNATADDSCFGFSGMMSGAPYLPNAAVIEYYSLVSSSDYAAGGSRQASDGKQVGADVFAIKTAQQVTQYGCTTPCGPGPNPDN